MDVGTGSLPYTCRITRLPAASPPPIKRQWGVDQTEKTWVNSSFYSAVALDELFPKRYPPIEVTPHYQTDFPPPCRA